MKIKIVDINGLATYTNTENIVALNSFYNQNYRDADIYYRVIFNGNCNIEITEQSFNNLKELLYDNFIEIE